MCGRLSAAAASSSAGGAVAGGNGGACSRHRTMRPRPFRPRAALAYIMRSRPVPARPKQQHGPHNRRGDAPSGGFRVRLRLLQRSRVRRRRAAHRRLAGGRRGVLHRLSALHQSARLRPCHPRGHGALQNPRRPGRDIPIQGAHHGGIRHGGHRQHRRGGHRHLHRRPGRHVLADRLRAARHVHKVRRMHAGRAVSTQQSRRLGFGRADVLLGARLGGTPPAAAGEGARHLLCGRDGVRLPGHRQHVSSQPSHGHPGGRYGQRVPCGQRMAHRRRSGAADRAGDPGRHQIHRQHHGAPSADDGGVLRAVRAARHRP